MFEAKQNELLATQLDLIKTTSEYYLNVMKSRKDFLILWENLRNSRKNLTIAKQKFDAEL
jgi:outer membrane protein TolC